MNRVCCGAVDLSGIIHGEAVFKMNTTASCGEIQVTPQNQWNLQEKLAFWDDETHDWKVNSGQYSILLGTSSRHISHILSFTKE